MRVCYGERILETLAHLTRSASGLPRTQEALSDAFLAVFMALGDDRRAGQCNAEDKSLSDPTRY